MSSTPPIGPHHVAVEGFDLSDESHAIAIKQGVTVSELEQSSPSGVGRWFEGLTALFLLPACWGVFKKLGSFIASSDLGIAILFIGLGLTISILWGVRNGAPGRGRLVFSLLFMFASVVLAVIALVHQDSDSVAWMSIIALALVISGWTLFRLTGESFMRSISLGALVAVPLLCVVDPISIPVSEAIERIVGGVVTTLFDFNSIAYGIKDHGFEFVSGSITSLAIRDNYAGVLGIFGFVLAMSVILRQSLILAFISSIAAILWWSIARGIICLWVVEHDDWSGTWNSIAMPQYCWYVVLFLIGTTQLFLSYLLGSIPLEETNIEHPLLAQLYNWVVNFPQTGSRSRKLFMPRATDSLGLWNSNSIQIDSNSIDVFSDLESNEAGANGVYESDWEPLVTGSTKAKVSQKPESSKTGKA